MCDPWYRDFNASELPRFKTAEGASVTVIAGRSHGIRGAIERETTEPIYLDVELSAEARLDQPLPPGHNAFVYVYRGSIQIAGEPAPQGRMAILANAAAADGVKVEGGTEGARFLIIAGRPLNEPIAQYGPFVMNTQQELHQAVADFRSGRLA
jgi:redox-sensitive bicupin YhaK (pirin superfamily)